MVKPSPRLSGAPPDCSRCPALVESRQQVVNGRGSLGGICIVGQGPGVQEDKKGRAFVGGSGRLLRALLEAAHIPANQVFLTNAVRCWTPGNRKPKKAEIDACREFLLEEIRDAAPAVVVSMGEPALTSLCGKTTALGSVLGHTLSLPDVGMPVIPTYHPAYLLRGAWEMAGLVISHLEKAARYLNDEALIGGLGDYRVIGTLEALEALREYLLSDEVEYFAFDTETTGLDWKQDELLCISISPRQGEAYIIPLLRKGRKPYWIPDEFAEVYTHLDHIFGSDKRKYAHNSIFDRRFLSRLPWDFVGAATTPSLDIGGTLADTMLLHHSFAESQPHNLTALTALFTAMPYYESEVNKASKGKARMEDAPDRVVWQYAGADADAVARLVVPFEKRATVEGTDWALENIMYPLSAFCWQMEQRGVLVDLPLFNRLCAHYRDRIAEQEEELWQHHEPFKYLDSGNLQKVLFQELDLPPTGKKTEGGRGCQACDAGLCFEHDRTDKDALKQLEEETGHPILPILRELRSLNKLRSTYLDGGQGGIQRYISPDDRIRCTYKPGGTETSRLSSEKPNMQNIPKEVVIPQLGLVDAFRECFVAPEGKGFMEADWSQLEVWGAAYLMEDKRLLEVLQSGQDVHVWVGRQIWPVDPEMTDFEWKNAHGDLRRRAKVFVFGTDYGLTVEGAADRLGSTVEEAQVWMDAYFQIVPGLEPYFRAIRRDIEERGYVSNVFGQRRHFSAAPLLKTLGRHGDFDAILREGVNYPIQSSGSGLHSIASCVTEASEALHKRGVSAVLSIHDSLGFEFDWPDQDYAVNTAWMIKNLWENVARKLILPTGEELAWEVPVELHWGKSWGRPEWRLSAKGDIEPVSYKELDNNS